MKPRIFVSSTFYDLKYIREELSNFIKRYDFEPVLFEDGDVGYIQGKNLDESCYYNVYYADMVILIIGGNYGSPASSHLPDNFKEYLSITRKEFQTANNHGIPIFVFVEKNVYAEYGIYEENISELESGKNIKFKATNNINVFRFIKEVKNSGYISITEFSQAIEIKEFLRKQWADIFKRSLSMQQEEKRIKNLEEAVTEMQRLIAQMNVMISGIGRRVLDSNSEEYQELVDNQKVLDICFRLAEHMRLTSPNPNNRDNNVDFLVKGLNETRIIMNQEDGLTTDKLFKIIIDVYAKYDLSIFYLHTSRDFIKLIFDLNLANQELKMQEIKSMLTDDKYYCKIFSTKVP